MVKRRFRHERLDKVKCLDSKRVNESFIETEREGIENKLEGPGLKDLGTLERITSRCKKKV